MENWASSAYTWGKKSYLYLKYSVSGEKSDLLFFWHDMNLMNMYYFLLLLPIGFPILGTSPKEDWV